MKQTIKVHSMVDVITNSSTVIYTSAHGSSVKYMKELVDTILTVAGSDKTSDDLFEFQIVPSDEYRDHFVYEEYEQSLDDDDRATYKALGWEEQRELGNNAYEACLKDTALRPEDWGKVPTEWDDPRESTNLIVTAKNNDKVSLDIMSTFSSLFSQDAWRDG